ncbi:MAG: NAD(P)/FAD-dependent oxidoreductase [Anaerolineae bacterium]
MNRDYDVIIVGGRAAGTHMAARLGKYGFRVLMLERNTHPSLPAVSSPIIFSATMRLLDEIGADEQAYAHNTPKLTHASTLANGLEVSLRIPDYKGRDYAYAIDRARFDASLWQTALTYDNVQGRQNFSVTDLLWDGDTVMGVVGKEHGGTEERITANVVIGADGRFGIVSRKVHAQETDVFETHPTSIYYAYWRDVAQVNDQPSMTTYVNDNNTEYGYLTMDSADGQTAIGIEGRADVVEPDAGDAQGFYLRTLAQCEPLQARLANAEMVTTVRGMRHIGNSYRQAGGQGWALIGDAYHQKDPLDGQGIYNAVITGKALARQMLKWKRGEINWETAISEYDDIARVKTYPMYKSLQNRIQTSFYSDQGATIPTWLQDSLARWVLDDAEFQELVGKLFTREVPPDYITLMTPPTLVGAVARGIRKDIEQRVKARIPFLN